MADLPVSPLAPACFPEIEAVPGILFSVVQSGIRYKGRPDLLLVSVPECAAVAGVFTKTKTPAAPVDWCRDALRKTGGRSRALLVNAGNANAFTGARGAAATKRSAELVADLMGCDTSEVLLASTGVIGNPLNADLFEPHLANLKAGLSPDGWLDAARAISTTDTFKKGAFRKATIDGKTVKIAGICKGSGMIAPDMATMLGFIFTDAALSPDCLQALLSDVTEKSFNAVTVDGDTSTNDTVIAFAVGEDNVISDPNDPRLDDFKAQFTDLAVDLAQQLAKDGEGATKFITVTIEGAEDDIAAKKIALAIANSPLVKTAVAGEDANWGRLVMAVGKSGEAVDRDALQIWIGDQHVAEHGMVRADYSEADASAHMKEQNIVFRLDVGVGAGSATVWTCDLTHGYISINADYRS